MAQRRTVAQRATRMGPDRTDVTLTGTLPGPTFVGATLTRRPYVDFGYLASAACRG